MQYWFTVRRKNAVARRTAQLRCGVQYYSAASVTSAATAAVAAAAAASTAATARGTSQSSTALQPFWLLFTTFGTVTTVAYTDGRPDRNIRTMMTSDRPSWSKLTHDFGGSRRNGLLNVSGFHFGEKSGNGWQKTNAANRYSQNGLLYRRKCKLHGLKIVQELFIVTHILLLTLQAHFNMYKSHFWIV